MPCPNCGSYDTIKNGKSSTGVQRYKCKICGRSYVSSRSSFYKTSTQKQNVRPYISQTSTDKKHDDNHSYVYNVSAVPTPTPEQNKHSHPSQNTTDKKISVIVGGIMIFIIGVAIYLISGGIVPVIFMIIGAIVSLLSFIVAIMPDKIEKEDEEKSKDFASTIKYELPDEYDGKSIAYKFGNVDVCVIHGKEPDYKLLSVGNTVEFQREPSNPYDENAVALYVNSIKIGYLYRGKIQDITNEYLCSGDVKSILGIITMLEETQIQIDIGLYKHI